MENENAVMVRKQQELGEVNLPDMMSMADTLIKSGFLPAAIKTGAQAVAIMLTGRELGIPTMQALRQINVIQGKPTMAAELMLSLAYKHVPGFKYSVVETTSTRCVCKFERPGHAPLTHKFDMGDAKALGLDSKDNWKKQPATMLRWRCISSGLRLVAPDAIAGVYTPEEIVPDARVNVESGTIIETESIDRPPVTMPTPKATAPAENPPQSGASSFAELPGCISEKQAKRMFAISHKSGVSQEALKAYLTEIGIEHTNQIKRGEEYDTICKWIEDHYTA